MERRQLVQAIDIALDGKWEQAHRIVQQHEDEFACWIHAVLHKIEGDESNSRYWYTRAHREFDSTLSPRDELHEIRTRLSP